MQLNNLDTNTIESFAKQLQQISDELRTDVVFYNGPIAPEALPLLRDVIEACKKNGHNDHLAFILTTLGGSSEVAAKMVDIIRHHYSKVSFFVPDIAMSAGTILCLSGDDICMDYYSSLGPVDPQVLVRKEQSTQFVPALGYLEQAEKLIEKSKRGTISPIEYAMLKDMDLAMLKLYEQAQNLSITLIKEWLVKYKFKSWRVHKTNPTKKGKEVSIEEKKERAEEIARLLSDYKVWLSHGRRIGIDVLKERLRLDINDYTDKEVWLNIRKYSEAAATYTLRSGGNIFIQSIKEWGII